MMRAMGKKNIVFGKKLKELREAANLSRYALSIKCGISDTALAKLEKGDNQPSFETVVRLHYALEVPFEAFLTMDKNEFQRDVARKKRSN